MEELNVMDKTTLRKSSSDQAKPDYFFLKEMEEWEMDKRQNLKNRIKKLAAKNIYKKEMI